MKLGIIFGGMSSEHDVSIVSATSVIKNLNKQKYDIKAIYISQDGTWYELQDDINLVDIYKIGMHPTNIKKITNIINYLKKLDCVFPVLHGLYGEDGTIQGLLKLLSIPCVGCSILASSICMDKVYTKIILRNAGINVTPDLYLKFKNNKYYYIDQEFNEFITDFAKIDSLIKEKFNYPVFVKPANSGSSVGVMKAHNLDELKKAISEAKIYDSKILIEKAIKGREVELAILNDQVSNAGEILASENFYTFHAKYKNNESKTVIPADLPEIVVSELQNIAQKAFRAVDGHTLSRIDFFIEDKTNKIYLNEINTMPGFTEISMYPKLIENMNINYTELLDILIANAM